MCMTVGLYNDQSDTSLTTPPYPIHIKAIYLLFIYLFYMKQLRTTGGLLDLLDEVYHQYFILQFLLLITLQSVYIIYNKISYCS